MTECLNVLELRLEVVYCSQRDIEGYRRLRPVSREPTQSSPIELELVFIPELEDLLIRKPGLCLRNSSSG